MRVGVLYSLAYACLTIRSSGPLRRSALLSCGGQQRPLNSSVRCHMDRRTFSIGSISLVLGSGLPLAGCDQKMGSSQPQVAAPPFSPANFLARLEELRMAFEAKGLHVSPSFLPPVDEASLRQRCTWFPAQLPEELITLYAWHEGQSSDAWSDDGYPYWFRDCAFSSLKTAESEYKSMMDTYGAHPQDHDLLRCSFPFAAFNGGWLVLPCQEQKLDIRLKRPVISVMQGIDVWFYSMGLMIDTCIDWVAHPAYGHIGNSALPEQEEMAIWRRHNPGIFSGGT